MKPQPIIPGQLPRGAGLDSLLTVEEFAHWIGMAPITVRRHIRAGVVPGVVRVAASSRIHPRTFLAKQGPAFRESVTSSGK